MTIAYIANVRLPTQKAHGYQIMKMCEALARKGGEVELVVPRRKRFVAEDPFAYGSVARIFRIVELPTSDFISGRIMPRRIAFFIDACSFVFRAFIYVRNKDNIDVIYARDREIAILSWFLKIPMVFEIHFLPRMIFLYKILWQKLFKMVTITHALKSLLEDAGFEESRIVVLPDAVDLTLFDKKIDPKAVRKELNIRDDQFVALYAGQLFSWKGAETLVAASAALPDNYAVLIVGGDAGDIERLKNIPHKSVIFLGQRPAREIPQFLKVADILVLPNSAKYPISKYYTSPLKLFEYMASGTPIVASDLPSLREILNEQNAFFFEPDNAVALTDTIRHVKENKKEALKRSIRALEDVKSYTWENRAKHIYDILGNI